VAHYVFEVAGRERLTVPAGEFDALHLVKRDDDGRSTQIWLDAGRSYLPLRLLVVQKDGTRIDQVAARITTAQ
jgi:negative regulator of sigma E activity